MKNIVIPFFDAADLAALPVVLDNLSVLQPERVVAIVNPSIGVDSTSVSAKFENQILDIRASMKQAVEREDFVAANSFKEELQGVQVQRDLALREGYKHLNPEQLLESWRKALKPLDDGGAMIIGFTEVYQKDNLPNALQSVQKHWPAEIPHGEYSVVWPLSLKPVPMQSEVMGGGQIPDDSNRKSEKPNEGKSPLSDPSITLTPHGERHKELQEMHHLKVLKIAKDHGVWSEGMKTPEAIQAILAKEFSVAA